MRNFVKNRFGSKLGLARLIKFQLLNFFGCYRNLTAIPADSGGRLVFICMGNICRSPLAMAVARSLGMETCSYGLSTRGGDKADPRAIEFAEQLNLDLSEHRTSPISNYQPKATDLLICMEPAQYHMLETLYPNIKITILGLWLNKPIAYLHDPYNTNSQYFGRCETMVYQATKNLCGELARNGK